MKKDRAVKKGDIIAYIRKNPKIETLLRVVAWNKGQSIFKALSTSGRVWIVSREYIKFLND